MYREYFFDKKINPFDSFLMAGFECADHQNAFGDRVDLYRASGHDIYLADDYELLSKFHIKTVREGIRWSSVETIPYQYDWTEVENIIRVSQEKGIQVIWDICHFGYPDDLTPLHPMFARRFSHLCSEFVKKARSIIPINQPLIVTPINEVSFISWLGGDVRGTSPYCIGQGWEVKYALMKAYIEGIEMMKMIDSSLRIMVTEPLINIVSNSQDPLDILKADKRNIEQFQVHDILSGAICPELRGKPEYLDLIGVNYYYNNQWINETHEVLLWTDNPPHPTYKSLQTQIENVFVKYGRPIIISETSHPGEDRKKWIDSVATDCCRLLQSGIPLLGCCIYPFIDRPDWDNLSHWHHSGIYDIYDPTTLGREINVDAQQALKNFSNALRLSESVDHK
ncbi:hypothetical protein IX39_00410 [Chryseobacterium formosense]|uniref:Amine oxidase n=1 Tax=Chryseobacterium formosense TaxID=236814 RepID=A0A085Z421_9FLAO|nr:hypothetical protein [Chryseobacterium formosense]KFE99184.1 hypothetical protein IX39_00410 [Chryseobacterium formosense]SFT47411.1 Beta-glucosidase/6-phospho-beta-glucosidase/beta-galactosidase [Chryseobacterium formosense]